MSMKAVVTLWWEGSNKEFEIEEGKDLRLERSDNNEEGWFYETEHLWLEDGIVYRESQSGGCDCDGRIDHFSEMQCPVEKLCAIQSGNGKYNIPAWEEMKRWKHDHEAIRAGY